MRNYIKQKIHFPETLLLLVIHRHVIMDAVNNLQHYAAGPNVTATAEQVVNYIICHELFNRQECMQILISEYKIRMINTAIKCKVIHV